MDFGQKSVTITEAQGLVAPRKLDVALRDSFSFGFRKRVSNQTPSIYDKIITDDIVYRTKINDIKESPTYMAGLLKIIINDNTPLILDTDNTNFVHRITTILLTTYEVQMSYCQSQNLTHIKNKVLGSLAVMKTEFSFPPVIYNLVYATRYFEGVISKTSKMFEPFRKGVTAEEKLKRYMKETLEEERTLKIRIRWNKDLMFLVVENRYYLLPRQALLLIHNKLSDLLSILVMFSFAERNTYPDGSLNIVLDFVHEGINLLNRYERKFFSIMKVLEGIVIGETLLQVEEWKNGEFLQNIVEELENDLNYDYYSSRLREIFLVANIPLRNELGCMNKIFGHPLVSMRGGAQALHRKTHEKTEIDMNYVLSCINHFKRDYIKKYVNKYGGWPPTVLTSKAVNKALEFAYIHGLDPDSLKVRSKMGRVAISDYIFVDLLPNMRFHKLDNIIPHLKDKTISIVRSKVWNTYIKQSGDVKTSWKDTRLLLAYLLNPTMIHDHVRYLDDYTNCDDLEVVLDYLIIRIVPKEKELKDEFRGFGCKTYEDRHKSLAQEKNVMRFLDEFSDEQAMTLSELSLLKKLDAFRRITSAYKNHTPIYIVIDASSWNNRFRRETVDIMMKDTLDKVFDTSIFSKTHEAYEKTLFVVPDHAANYYWEGQAGGIEGLNQDTWVVTYLAQMRVAMEKYDYPYHMLCKGDDLRIVLLIPNETLTGNDIKSIKNHVVNHISKTAKKFGHTINIEESFGSSKFLAFSKDASIEEAELPQTSRKIQKVYGATNAFINTKDDYIASSFSNAHSACSKSAIISPCYKTGLFWSIYYLLSTESYRSLTDNQISALLMIPSLVGGFPIIYLHNMAIRAESDLLSPFLGLIKFCDTKYPMHAEIMRNFLTIPYIEDVRSKFVGFLMDPYSLPISRPSLAAAVLRSKITPALKRVSKNRDLLDLIQASESDDADIFIDALYTANVLRAKALALIFASTPRGVLMELCRKFESGRSVMELIILRFNARTAKRVMRSIQRADDRVNTWRLNRIKGFHLRTEMDLSQYITICPAESADKIREVAWGRKVEDITMPPMQHQIMLSYAICQYMDHWKQNNHFTFRCSQTLKDPSKSRINHFMVGEHHPFKGFSTSSGSLAPSIHFIEKDVCLSKIKTLLDLISWLNVSKINADGTEVVSNAVCLIEKVIRCYTPTPLKVLMPFSSVRKSGTSQHHMRSPGFRESIVPNVLSNVYTRISGESNTHVRLRTSSQHFKVNFLHSFCWCTWLIYSELELSRNTTNPEFMWGVTVDCEFCNRPIEETPLVFNSAKINACYTDILQAVKLGEISESILKDSIEEFNTRTCRVDISEDTTIDISVACRGLLATIIDETYTKRKKMQDRLGHHSWSSEGAGVLAVLYSEGMSRDIGLTEIKRMGMDDVCDYLMHVVINMLPDHCMAMTLDKIENWISLLPANEIPWNGLVRMIYEAGRLLELVQSMGRRSNIPSFGCGNNPLSATKYIGLCCIGMLVDDIYIPKQDLVILSYYKRNKLETELMKCIRTFRSSTLSKNYDWKLLGKIKQPHTDLEETTLMMCIRSLVEALMTYYLYPDNISLIAEDILALEALEINSITISNAEYVDAHLILDIVENYAADNEYDYYQRKILTLIHRGMAWLHTNIEDIIFDQYDIFMDKIVNSKEHDQVMVHYTTLSECIDVIRKNIHQVSETDDSLELEADDTLEDTLRMDMRNLVSGGIPYAHFDKNKMSTPSIVGFDTPCRITNTVYSPEVPRLPDHLNEYLNPSYIFKILGQENDSVNSFLYIFNILGLLGKRKELIYKKILCLSDGFGGASCVIDHLVNESMIIWNSKVTDYVNETLPIYLLEHQSNNNTLVYDYVNRGLDDVTKPETLEYLMSGVGSYDIITSDIEYPRGDDTGYYTYWRNVLTLIITTISPSGLVILRLDLAYISIVCRILDILMECCVEWGLIKCPNESYITSMYFVGKMGPQQVSLPLTEERLLISLAFCSRKCFHTVNLYIKQLNEVMTTVINTIYLTLDLSKFSSTYMKPYRNFLGSYGRSKYSKEFNQNMYWDLLMQDIVSISRGDSHPLDKKYNVSLETKISSITMLLNKPDQRIERQQSFDINTRTSHIELLTLLLKCYGFEYSASLFVNIHDSYYHNLRSLKDYFLSVLSSLNRRYLLSGINDEIFYASLDCYQSDRYLWSAFLEGIGVWMSIYSFLTMCSDIKERMLYGQDNNEEEDYIQESQ